MALVLIDKREINPVIHWNILIGAVVQLVDTANIDATDFWRGSSLMMCHDPTFGTEMMCGDLRIPFVTYQRIITFLNFYVLDWARQHYRATPLTQTAIATPRCG